MTEAEIAEAMLLGMTCNSCSHIFWLLKDPTFICRYTLERRLGKRDPATLNSDPICDQFAPFEGLDVETIVGEQ